MATLDLNVKHDSDFEKSKQNKLIAHRGSVPGDGIFKQADLDNSKLRLYYLSDDLNVSSTDGLYVNSFVGSRPANNIVKDNIYPELITDEPKTIIGGINENRTDINNNAIAINNILNNIDLWQTKGTSSNARTWAYNLISGKKYRVRYNLLSSTNSGTVEKIFWYNGTNINLDQFVGFSILVVNNVTTLSASSTGITITSNSGTLGIIVNLEEKIN